MALTELLRTLEDEARHRIDAIRAAARAEADRLRREGDAEQADRRAAALSAHEGELRAAAARAVEAARREAAGRVLEARMEALARVRAGAGSRLAARAADPALLPLLRGDLLDGLGYLGEAPAVVEADPALIEGIRAALNGRPAVTIAPGAGGGGLLIRSADGTVTVDASFATRLESLWAALAIELSRRMEGGT
jgi:vacuolar-type H+-ATPase subunit E/Vma4